MFQPLLPEHNHLMAMVPIHGSQRLLVANYVLAILVQEWWAWVSNDEMSFHLVEHSLFTRVVVEPGPTHRVSPVKGVLVRSVGQRKIGFKGWSIYSLIILPLKLLILEAPSAKSDRVLQTDQNATRRCIFTILDWKQLFAKDMSLVVLSDVLQGTKDKEGKKSTKR